MAALEWLLPIPFKFYQSIRLYSNGHLFLITDLSSVDTFFWPGTPEESK